ncbi:hypothetical protein [Novosphingobium sp. MBES04]|uniref:hypothetical protein n=1 Tax=Novosphingobium sp. MBES04 TaxID=1206458 RepID=UPI0011846E41|nr:hypothetical protein [Novosphingobium sp. MBES04]
MPMGPVNHLEFLQRWDCDESAPAFRRLDRLLGLDANLQDAAQDTPGGRNLRYVRLQAELGGGGMEAQAACPACAELCEFALPLGAMLESVPPASDLEVGIEARGERWRFRLPRMSDLAALPPGTELGHALAETCRLDDHGAPVPDLVVEALGRELDAADPLATPVVELTCSACQTLFSASVDLASFVAREMDRLANRLLRDVHLLARAYGWSEEAILAIPPARRRRYLALIGQDSAPVRALAV